MNDTISGEGSGVRRLRGNLRGAITLGIVVVVAFSGGGKVSSTLILDLA